MRSPAAVCCSSIRPRVVRVCRTPTLFPYTTLFRSEQGLAALRQAQEQLAHLDARLRIEPVRRLVEDRKSTRLNSSHQIISYAVFCLKKKKRATTPRPLPPSPVS